MINLALPLMLGLGIVEGEGRLGLAAALVVLFAVGCYFCWRERKFANTLIVGALFVGLSQIFAIFQTFACVAGMIVIQALGLASPSEDFPFQKVASGPGGVILTLVTGGILMAASAACGVLIRTFTPGRWWPKPAEDHPV